MNIIKTAKKINTSGLIAKTKAYCRKNSIRLKLIALLLICSGMIIRGIMQQPQIIKNKAEIANLNDEISYEKDRQQEVEKMKDIVGTDEYIEKIAREKLGMIKANEKIFIDVSKSQDAK